MQPTQLQVAQCAQPRQEHTDQSDVTDHVLDVKLKNMAEFDEQLICAVKEGPCLYNVRSSDFKVTWKEENA